MMMFFLALLCQELTPVLEINDQVNQDKLIIAEPVDAVFFDDRLYYVDINLKMLIITDTTKRFQTVGGQGKGPKDIRDWPEIVGIEAGKVVFYEWNNRSRHTYSLDGAHIQTERLGNTLTGRVLRGDLSLRDLPYKEALATSKLWQLEGTLHYLGTHPPKELFYNFLLGPSKAAISSNGLIGIMTYGGRLELYRQAMLVDTIQFPLEIFKIDYVVDTFRRGFFASQGVTEKNAWLNGTPVVDFAIRDKDTIWMLARNEHVNAAYGKANEMWLFTYHKGTIEKQKLDASFDRIRYDYGYLLLVSRHDAVIRVFKVH